MLSNPLTLSLPFFLFFSVALSKTLFMAIKSHTNHVLLTQHPQILHHLNMDND
jgi:hypothetical protein